MHDGRLFHLVEIDGVQNGRPATRWPMVFRSNASVARRSRHERKVDIVIIGAGPAGMACAIEAAGKVCRRSFWTKIRRRAARRTVVGAPDKRLISWALTTQGKSIGFRTFAKRQGSTIAAQHGVEYRPDRRVEFSQGGRSFGILGSVVVATGALGGHRRFRPTLPGVTTVGALQILRGSASFTTMPTMAPAAGCWRPAGRCQNAAKSHCRDDTTPACARFIAATFRFLGGTGLSAQGSLDDAQGAARRYSASFGRDEYPH